MPSPAHRAGLLIALCAAAAGCSDGGGGTPLIDPGDAGLGEPAALIVLGPNEAASGTLEVEADSLTGGFLVTVLDASGDPVPDVYVAIEPEDGIVNAPPDEANSGGGLTGDDGELAFAYQAPDDVLEAARVAITLHVDGGDGGTIEETYELTVLPAAPPKLTFSGPTDVAPGVSNAGFTLAVTKDSGGQVAGACVHLSASHGSLSPAPDTTCDADGLPGYTATSTGRVTFSYMPPAEIAVDTAVTLSASTTVASQDATAEYPLTIRADTFRFTSPAAGTVAVIGEENRLPLRFQWTRDELTPFGAEGVSGTVVLEASSGGQLMVGDVAGGASVEVRTRASTAGDFEDDVWVYARQSGSVTVTATDPAADREARLTLAFSGEPSEVRLDASPLVVEASPSEARFSTLTVTVLNQVGEPIEGVEVEFQLLRGAGGVNESVFPSRQLTGEDGQAESRYEAGTETGSARVQATVQGALESNVRTITVQ